MRRISELEGSGEVVLAVQREQREIPPLILQQAGERGVVREAPLGAQAHIAQVAALQEHRIDLLLAILQLDGALGADPVSGGAAITDSLPAEDRKSVV